MCLIMRPPWGQKTVEATNAAAAASQLALGLSEAEQNAKDYRDAAYQHYLGEGHRIKP